jgi:hypothetical protein
MGGKGRTHGGHWELAELARGQYGVVATRQLERVGYSRNSISQMAAAGRLHPIHRGVYAVTPAPLDWHGRCLAAVLAAEPVKPALISVASHQSAAWLWGLLRTRPDAIHVTAPTRRRAKRAFTVHFARLLDRDRDVRDDIRVTSLARTLMDVAATSSPGRLEGCLERAEERGLFDLEPILELLDRAGGHRGRGRLRRALEIYREEPAVRRSGLERRFLRLVKAAGLPTPSMNFNVAGYELDAYWRPQRFAVELDVYETHGGRAAFERDRLRQENLKLAGVEMIRVTGPRLDREAGAVMERIAILLARRRAEPA